MKGVLETTTKLMWNCAIKFASSGGSQLVAALTFLELFSIELHWLFQVAKTKQDNTFYALLNHYHSARNRSQPYHKTLTLLVDWLIKQAKDATTTLHVKVPLVEKHYE